jgi:exosortase
MGSPWRIRKDPQELSISNLIIAIAGFVIGLLMDLVTLLAACWTYLLWTWICARVDERDIPALRRLMILPFLAFPWLNLEGNVIGWYFRLSGSWITAMIFSAMGFRVLHDGTQLVVQGLPVGIGEACSGINVLQSMLIAGSALAYLYLGKHKTYWWNLLILIAIAWLANTLRIVILCITALTMGQEFAMGVFHTWGGWLILFIMMCLSWGSLSLQATYMKRSTLPISP